MSGSQNNDSFKSASSSLEQKFDELAAEVQSYHKRLRGQIDSSSSSSRDYLNERTHMVKSRVMAIDEEIKRNANVQFLWSLFFSLIPIGLFAYLIWSTPASLSNTTGPLSDIAELKTELGSIDEKMNQIKSFNESLEKSVTDLAAKLNDAQEGFDKVGLLRQQLVSLTKDPVTGKLQVELLSEQLDELSNKISAKLEALAPKKSSGNGTPERGQLLEPYETGNPNTLPGSTPNSGSGFAPPIFNGIPQGGGLD